MLINIAILRQKDQNLQKMMMVSENKCIFILQYFFSSKNPESNTFHLSSIKLKISQKKLPS